MKLIQHYFPNLTDFQLNQIQTIEKLYPQWNEQINVISRKDIEHLEERHILHSMAIGRYFNFPDNSRVLDVGTGGGFPGIPLAIMFPNVHFTLNDAIGKKIKVAKDIAQQAGLTNIEVIHSRVEDLKSEYHYVVSRAVTAFPDFVKMCKPKIAKQSNNSLKNGIIYLKGGDFDEEVKAFNETTTIYPLSDAFKEEFFLTKKIIYFQI